MFNNNNDYTNKTHNDPINEYQQIELFHDQLKEILNIFPPLITVMNIDNNPEKQLSDLYQIFLSNQPTNNVYIPPSPEQQQTNMTNYCTTNQFTPDYTNQYSDDIYMNQYNNITATEPTYSPQSNSSVNNNYTIDNQHSLFNINNNHIHVYDNTLHQSHTRSPNTHSTNTNSTGYPIENPIENPMDNNNINMSPVNISNVNNNAYMEPLTFNANNTNNMDNINNISLMYADTHSNMYNRYCNNTNTNTQSTQLLQEPNINQSSIGSLKPQTKLEKAVQNELNGIRRRIKLRIEKIVSVVNSAMYRMVNNNFIRFSVNKLFEDYIMFQVEECFSSWSGGKHFNEITEQTTCNEKSRKYWSRHKIVNLGNTLFGPILIMAFEYIMNQNGLNISERLLLYIDITRDLIIEKIKYARTKPKPLIMLACYWKPNKFRDILANIIHCFGRDLHWDPIKHMQVQMIDGKRVYKYIKDQNRSQDIHDEFEKLLRLLKQQLLINMDLNFLNHAIEQFSQSIL